MLFLRSTRSFGLTEAGTLVHTEFSKIAEAQRAIREGLAADAPRGAVRITAPFSLALNMIVPTLPEFFSAYPSVALSFSLDIRQADLIGENFDVAIRAGRMQNSSLVGRRLGASHHIVCASPAYLAARPILSEPKDLAAHAILAFDPTVEHPAAGRSHAKKNDKQSILHQNIS